MTPARDSLDYILQAMMVRSLSPRRLIEYVSASCRATTDRATVERFVRQLVADYGGLCLSQRKLVSQVLHKNANKKASAAIREYRRLSRAAP